MLSATVLLALLMGLAAFALVESARRLPVIREWAQAGRKPWACDPCSSFWAPLLVAPVFGIAFGEWRSVALAQLPASGVCLLMLTWRSSKTPSNPSLGGLS